jgi:hypothetical protein
MALQAAFFGKDRENETGPMCRGVDYFFFLPVLKDLPFKSILWLAAFAFFDDFGASDGVDCFDIMLPGHIIQE